ncbi:MAG: hypothetical protein Q4A92_08350 [Corynebacterium sp.]|nr:hypothetical protein [Corynebacterium sp.]
MRKPLLIFDAAVTAMWLAACSGEQLGLPNSNNFAIGRDPSAPVIQDVSEIGVCATHIISVEQDPDGSATITYRGRPGDQVTYSLQYSDGSEATLSSRSPESMVQDAHVSPEQTRNLIGITASATSDVGTPNSCSVDWVHQ